MFLPSSNPSPVRFPRHGGNDGKRSACPTDLNLVELRSLRQQGHGFAEWEIGGEDFAAVGLPVKGSEAGAGERTFGLARQLDDRIGGQSFILKNLFGRSHVIGRGYY